MGDRVDREVAMSRRDKEVETEAAWQSHYIFWCSMIGIPDPCGNKIGYQHIVTIYTKFVMCGINYYNKDILWSSTLWRCATTVNTLFQLRGFKQPTNLSNLSNMAGIIINNLINEETVASHCSPLDSTIFAELQWAASSSHSCDSDWNLLFDILTPTHFIGPCISEYTQTTQNKVDYHVYPSETRVIKVFTANYFVFYNKNGHALTKNDSLSFDLATFIQITWHIQKNHQNSQKIRLSVDTKNPTICLVWGALQMVMRACCLAQPDDMPVACYRTKNAPLLFITGSRMPHFFAKQQRKYAHLL